MNINYFNNLRFFTNFFSSSRNCVILGISRPKLHSKSFVPFRIDSIGINFICWAIMEALNRQNKKIEETNSWKINEANWQVNNIKLTVQLELSNVRRLLFAELTNLFIKLKLKIIVNYFSICKYIMYLNGLWSQWLRTIASLMNKSFLLFINEKSS